MARQLSAGELALVEALQKTDKRRLVTLFNEARARKTRKVCLSRKAKRQIEDMLEAHHAAVVKMTPRGIAVYTLEGHMAHVRNGQRIGRRQETVSAPNGTP